ncbi:MAG: CHASE2 domain-containing protein [Moorea sp. SIO4A1]|uniref:CHASE2 domain-containing protein n=1 Tax=Moorena sp. SIO4A1 TaxID=2607835 RepID=UPI00144C99A1|nr:CHASE2 domain-containing protein [Moorena sp. SIO4A1]NEQ56940.1 CHASE2 domain-containing protein [Moorena sp. SIO4A1]
MKRLLTLILDGEIEQGFDATLEIRQGDLHSPSQTRIKGRLSGNRDLLNCYRHWQQRYLSLEMLFRALSANPEQVTNSSQRGEAFAACRQGAEVLEGSLNHWLNTDPEFRSIRDKLLGSGKKFQLLLQTNNPWLRRFPWHRWDLLAEAQADVALSAIEYDCPNPVKRQITPKGKVKILAILGQGANLNQQADQQALEELAGQAGAQITWRQEPQASELNQQLWEQGWDILFFAGHSGTSQEGQRGEIQLNQTERLTIDDLRFALKNAIARGLQLAIFNSCDGLGLAYQLAAQQDLYLPQVIVMAEKVPDPVSPKFLRYFLDAYIRGESLYSSVAEAREKLHGWEQQYPCASWLPVVCQNPTVQPPTWKELRYGPINQSPWQLPRTAVIASFMVTLALMVVRPLGVIQPWELQAYDQFMRWRPDQGVDPRLLVVEITEEDFQYQDDQGMKRKWSLSDAALAQLLDKLQAHHPRAIGLDIYRDFPVSEEYQDLANRLPRMDNFFAVCQASNPTDNNPGIAPPPEVPPERLGFTDVVIDSDGVLRRYLWYATFNSDSPCQTETSLSLQLALHYLAADGIDPKVTPEGEVQLGETTLRSLPGYAGNYSGTSNAGYQMLLDYRTPGDIAQRVTLKQILTDQFEPSWVKDRVVLIGVTAPSVRDDFSTPFTRNSNQTIEMRGVFIQAQMVSQILSAVKDGRKLLWVWSQWGEFFWIWAWGSLGGFLVLVCKRLVYGLGVGIANLVVLSGVCFVVFIQSWWIPLVPSGLAFVATGMIVGYKRTVLVSCSVLGN